MKPEYRVKMVIYEENSNETVTFSDEPLYSQDEETATQAYRLMTRFHIDKDQFEATHYPVNDEVDV